MIETWSTDGYQFVQRIFREVLWRQPNFRTEFDPQYGEAVKIADKVHRITVPNKSAFTFHGTNTYIVGTDKLAIIDPGPIEESHLNAIMNHVGDREVTHIIVTHTHVDHSPLSARLKELTGAKTWAEGPHRNARGPSPGGSEFA